MGHVGSGGRGEPRARLLLACPGMAVSGKRAAGGCRSWTLSCPRNQHTSNTRIFTGINSEPASGAGFCQLCVERHQMVCYETHFGQKIAGVFWFLGGQQS